MQKPQVIDHMVPKVILHPNKIDGPMRGKCRKGKNKYCKLWRILIRIRFYCILGPNKGGFGSVIGSNSYNSSPNNFPIPTIQGHTPMKDISLTISSPFVFHKNDQRHSHKIDILDRTYPFLYTYGS